MYIIKEENYNGIINQLGEVKAKESFNIIKTLLGCKRVDDNFKEIPRPEVQQAMEKAKEEVKKK